MSHPLDIKEAKHEFNAFMIITCGKYLELESQLGSLKSMVYWLVTPLVFPHESFLSLLPLSTTSIEDSFSWPFPGRVNAMRSDSPWVEKVPLDGMMPPCEFEEDNQGRGEDMDVQVGNTIEGSVGKKYYSCFITFQLCIVRFFYYHDM